MMVEISAGVHPHSAKTAQNSTYCFHVAPQGTSKITWHVLTLRSWLVPELAMRIWDVPPSLLCRAHLLGEHRELHVIWTVLVEGKIGYARHPETMRWQGKLAALYLRHESLVTEMTRRGYNHTSPLDPAFATGSAEQDTFVDPPDRQLEILRAKGCPCVVDQS
jgi:hypothetical protein